MKLLEAWEVISRELNELMWYRGVMSNMQKPFTYEEIEAEVMCFDALKKMEESEGEDD